ncbi:MAG TPA: hypothetical protein VFN23_05515, partial [Ktedonobacteraceae bacterium]|nr:hypothetical protein [Ktedonobacteraceae bacterium]
MEFIQARNTGIPFLPSSLLMMPVNQPLILLVPVLDIVVAALILLLIARPLAIAIYLQVIQKQQEAYYKVYTPLTAQSGLYKTPVVPYTGDTMHYSAEGQNILDLLQGIDTHQLILGMPGAGKTMVLREYEYEVAQHLWGVALGHEKVPVYVPLKNYSLFLKKINAPEPPEDDANENLPPPPAHSILLDFLAEEGLPYLRPYIRQLAAQGRVLFLCDGLNEVNSAYLPLVCAELAWLMQDLHNRLVMTCREVDYRELKYLRLMVEQNQVDTSLIYPLRLEQIRDFIEQYIQSQGTAEWQHSTDEIMQVIERSRLRYHCTNPMMLFTLMKIIDSIGVERGKMIDTRGLLLREFVVQLIQNEQEHPRWQGQAPSIDEVLLFLSRIAFDARWENNRNAIQLGVSNAGEDEQGPSMEELLEFLSLWLDEHASDLPFASTEDQELISLNKSYTNTELEQLLEFTRSTALIEIDSSGVLSFRHELIAEYFVAEYFFWTDSENQSILPLHPDLLTDVGRWSEPIAIWAGLVENPLFLAQRLATLGEEDPAYIYPSLVLSLMCIGVQWTPPEAEVQHSITLPPNVVNSLTRVAADKEARERVAEIFKYCANEGGLEVYRSLLPWVTLKGIDALVLR